MSELTVEAMLSDLLVASNARIADLEKQLYEAGGLADELFKATRAMLVGDILSLEQQLTLSLPLTALIRRLALSEQRQAARSAPVLSLVRKP